MELSFYLDRKLVKVYTLNRDTADQTVWVRARLHTSRGKGNLNILRLYVQCIHSDQASFKLGLS